MYSHNYFLCSCAVQFKEKVTNPSPACDGPKSRCVRKKMLQGIYIASTELCYHTELVLSRVRFTASH